MGSKILIIGGGSGIGKELVHRLTDEGHEVIAASRNIASADLPDGVQRQEFDVTKDDKLSLPDELQGLAYCPGTITLKPFNRISIDDLREELEINYLGAVKVVQQSVDALKKGEGSAVFFSTVAVQTGLPFHTAVSAAKGAVEGLVRSLAAEYAPSVRFNAIAPSLTDTPMAEALLNNDKKRESNAQRHPLKRVGKPSDISNMAAYLLSDQSSWISGQILKVDGGMSNIRSI